MSFHPRIGMHLLALSAAALLFAPTSFAQSQADKDFVTKAMGINLAEMQIGKLASEKGATQAVREFGSKTVADHTRLQNAITPIAMKLGLTPPSQLAADDEALLMKLQQESGSAFDETYIEAMVDGHHQALDLYKSEETDGTDPAVKRAATRGEPIIARHLSMAEHLQQIKTKS